MIKYSTRRSVPKVAGSPEYKKRLNGGGSCWSYVRIFLWSQDIQGNAVYYSNWSGEKTFTSNEVNTSRPSFSVDIMELPFTTIGNRYPIVFQHLFTKWPMVYAALDQKATVTMIIAKLLAR